jgi:hypothetical protein
MSRRFGFVAAGVVGVVLAGFLAGCGEPANEAGSATLQAVSVPPAEVWLDGKSAGTTPLDLTVSAGSHEVLFRQVGFEDRSEQVSLAAGGSQTVEATLVPRDPSDRAALELLAASVGITVEPVTAPELHRGASEPADVVLVWPRGDIRKEGLATWRVDISPAFEGAGRIEFRKGKTVLRTEPFDPQTLVTVGEIPTEVVEALKAGDTVTWGIWPEEGKPFTAQFEVVNKPQAGKRLLDMDRDRHIQRQPPLVQEMLKAEVLQSYRLYSEALVKFLEIKATDRDSSLPNRGIVACLRRMDLEESPLYLEAASRVGGKGGRRAGSETPIAGAGAPVVADRGERMADTGDPAAPSGLRAGGSVPAGLRPVEGAPSGSPASPTVGGIGTEAVEPSSEVVRAAADAASRQAEELARAAEESLARLMTAKDAAEAAERDAESAMNAANEAAEAVTAAAEAAEAAQQQAESSGSAEDRQRAEDAAKALAAAEASAAVAQRTAEEVARGAEAARQELQAAQVAYAEASARAKVAERAAEEAAGRVPGAPVPPGTPPAPDGPPEGPPAPPRPPQR